MLDLGDMADLTDRQIWDAYFDEYDCEPKASNILYKFCQSKKINMTYKRSRFIFNSFQGTKLPRPKPTNKELTQASEQKESPQNPRWSDYVDTIKDLGFSKVAIVSRSNFQLLAGDSAYQYVSFMQPSYIDGINPYQELLDDWGEQKRTVFRYFERRFQIIKRSTDFYYHHNQTTDFGGMKFEGVYVLLSGYLRRMNDIEIIPNEIQGLICNYMDKSMIKEECKYLVGLSRGREMVIAYQFERIWLIASYNQEYHGSLGRNAITHKVFNTFFHKVIDVLEKDLRDS